MTHTITSDFAKIKFRATFEIPHQLYVSFQFTSMTCLHHFSGYFPHVMKLSGCRGC